MKKTQILVRLGLFLFVLAVSSCCDPFYQKEYHGFPPSIKEEPEPAKQPEKFDYLAYIDDFRASQRACSMKEVFIGNYSLEDYNNIQLKTKRLVKKATYLVRFRTAMIYFDKPRQKIVVQPIDEASYTPLNSIAFIYGGICNVFGTAVTESNLTSTLSRKPIFPVFAKISEISAKFK